MVQLLLAALPSLATQKDDLNRVLKRSNRTLAFYSASHQTESPGLGLFRKNDANKGNLKDVHKRAKGDAPGEYVYAAYMGEVHMFVDVKTSDDLDPFTDPPDGDIPPEYRFTVNTRKKYRDYEELDDKGARVLALGRSARYAHVVQTRQFRTCIYSIFVAGTTARLLRWDRSGVIVTESFNYKSKPGILAGFVWLVSKATPEQRGFDPSAIATNSKAERLRFLNAIRKHVEEQLPGLSAKQIKEEVNKHYSPGAVMHLTVGTGDEAYGVLVSRPMFTSHRTTGQSTIGYWGVDCESGDGEVVFIKDIWRKHTPEVETEGVLLKGLLDKEVRNIPELVCHGDVIYKGEAIFLVSGLLDLILQNEGTKQTTQTNMFVEEDWVESLRQMDPRHRFTARIHYRLVTKRAGFRLSDLKGTKELLSATFDVFIGTPFICYTCLSLITPTL